MNKIIKPFFQGLGDHLQFSTLPEYFTELGHKVYLSDEAKAHNQEIIKLVWECNPYIKDLSGDKPNAGDSIGYKYENKYGGFIKNIEYLNGLEPKNDYPKLYYKPNKLWGEKHGLLELSFLSLKYDNNKVLKSVLNIIKNYDMPFVQVMSPYQKYNIVINNIEKLEVSSLFELTDRIYSCNVFISLSSGAQMLAGSIRCQGWEGEQHCVLPEDAYGHLIARKLFILPNVKYIKEGGQ